MVQQVNGFKLDKSHTFAVNMFDDVSRYMQIPDEYEPPEDKDFETPVSPRHPSTNLHAAFSCASPSVPILLYQTVNAPGLHLYCKGC